MKFFFNLTNVLGHWIHIEPPTPLPSLRGLVSIPWGVLVLLKFWQFTSKLTKTWSSGATECRVWIGNCNVKVWKSTEHKLHKIWRSLKFCTNLGKRAHPWQIVHILLLMISMQKARCTLSSLHIFTMTATTEAIHNQLQNFRISSEQQ